LIDLLISRFFDQSGTSDSGNKAYSQH